MMDSKALPDQSASARWPWYVRGLEATWLRFGWHWALVLTQRAMRRIARRRVASDEDDRG